MGDTTPPPDEADAIDLGAHRAAVIREAISEIPHTPPPTGPLRYTPGDAFGDARAAHKTRAAARRDARRINALGLGPRGRGHPRPD